MDSALWSRLSTPDTYFEITIAYTSLAPKGPAPPPEAGPHAMAHHMFRLAPPVPAEVSVGATSAEMQVVLDDTPPDFIMVHLDRALLLSYGCGPTLPRDEFVLFRDGAMGYVDSESDDVLRWDNHAPTWRRLG